jgi:hypothetical protein
MRGSGLTEMDPASNMPDKGALERLNQPLAREHPAHISGTNTLGDYSTPKPSLGTLGAKSQAGK